jgi:hypothetical protein
MALFRFVKTERYRLSLCNQAKEESSLEFATLQEAITQARQALAGDVLPTCIESYSSSDTLPEWSVVWYPDDTSGVYSERKMQISESLEGFIKSNA